MKKHNSFIKIVKNSIQVAVLFYIASSGQAFAQAGFNCAKARGEIEKIICQDPKLSKLDKELNVLFVTLKNKYPDQGKELIKSQKEWLLYDRDESCTEGYNCELVIERSYKDRLKNLQQFESKLLQSSNSSNAFKSTKSTKSTELSESAEPLELNQKKAEQGNKKFKPADTANMSEREVIALINKKGDSELMEDAMCNLIEKNSNVAKKIYTNTTLDIEHMPICHAKNIRRIIKEVDVLAAFLDEVWGEENMCVGSMIREYDKDQARENILIAMDPQANIKPEYDFNLADWGQQSLEQKFIAQKIAAFADKSKIALATYYSNQFDLDENKAREAAGLQIKHLIGNQALKSSYLNLSFFNWPSFNLKDLDAYLKTNIIPTEKLNVIASSTKNKYFTKNETMMELLKLALANLYPVEAIKKIVAYPNIKEAAAKFNEGKEVNILRWANYSPQVMALLMTRLKEIDTQDRYGKTPLIYAILSKNNVMVDFLIKAGADLTKGSQPAGNDCVKMDAPWGRTPLMYAILVGNVHAVEKIMSTYTDVVAQDDEGNTARFYLDQNKKLSPQDRKLISDLIS